MACGPVDENPVARAALAASVVALGEGRGGVAVVTGPGAGGLLAPLPGLAAQVGAAVQEGLAAGLAPVGPRRPLLVLLDDPDRSSSTRGAVARAAAAAADGSVLLVVAGGAGPVLDQLAAGPASLVLRTGPARSTGPDAHRTATVDALTRALAGTPPGAGRSPLLRELGLAMAASGDDEAAALLAEAARRATTPADRVAAASAQAEVLRATGRGGESVDVLLALEDDLGPADTAHRRAVDLQLLASTTTSRSARIRLQAWRSQLVVDPGGTPTDGFAALALATVALDGALDARPQAQVLDQLARAVAAAPRLDPPLRRQLMTIAAICYLCLEQLDAAGELADGLLERAAAQDDAALLATAHASRAGIALRRGRLDDAAAEAEMALQIGAGTALSRSLLTRAGAVLVSVAAARGTEPAEELLTAELDLDVINDRLLVHARAELRAARGEDHRAVAELLAYGARNAELGWDGVATPWRSQAATVLVRLGDPAAAADLVADELARARRAGNARATGVATLAAGRLATGAARTELLTAAVAALRGTPCALELTDALTELGTDLATTDRGRARELLREAHDLALACGATRLAAAAAAALRASGGRPRRVPAASTALTPAERAVAELVAAGSSNREVARTLFVTTKTVETHLRTVFRKLGVRSRAEVGAALPAPPCAGPADPPADG